MGVWSRDLQEDEGRLRVVEWATRIDSGMVVVGIVGGVVQA